MSSSIPETIKPSSPIPIARGRARSTSVSSASSGSASSASDIPTPPASATSTQRINIPSPSSSPILSHFISSPIKTPAATGFPFKHKFGTAPVFEEEEIEREVPAAVHARRASSTFTNRWSQAPVLPTPLAGAQAERGTNLLRRLSLSSTAFVKPPQFDAARSSSPPSTPPNTAVATSPTHAPFVNKPRRSATISSDGTKPPRRAPSPMGERILKGHFDGFN